MPDANYLNSLRTKFKSRIKIAAKFQQLKFYLNDCFRKSPRKINACCVNRTIYLVYKNLPLFKLFKGSTAVTT